MSKALKLGFYYLARISGGFALARRLTQKSARILCYHGGCVGDEWRYNGKLFMTRRTFEKRVAWLQASGFQLVSLEKALAFPRQYTGEPIAVAFTFDDGWFSTGKELLPVLFERNIPSVLYLSTKYFQDGTPITAVTIRYILWKAGNRTIEIRELGEGVDGSYDLGTASAREQLVSRMDAWLANKQGDSGEIVKALKTLARSAGIAPADFALDSRRFSYLRPDEILNYSKKRCSIELHGHIHAYPAGHPDRFKEDLQLCIKTIEALNLPTPKHYCYPSGNYDGAAAGVLESLGIESATTCVPGLIDSGPTTKQYYLPRFLDGENIHMLEFEAEMTGFAELLRRLIRRVKSAA